MIDVIEVPLTHGKVALIDAIDAEEIFKHKWYAQQSEKLWYAARAVKLNGKHAIMMMHRQLLPDALKVDHINLDSLDNRRINLRPCTDHQNRFNKSLRCDNPSGYKGVWSSGGKKKPWLASIGFNHKKIDLGTFRTKEEAARAYDEAAKLYFGEFAMTNAKLRSLLPRS